MNLVTPLLRIVGRVTRSELGLIALLQSLFLMAIVWRLLGQVLR
jgi:hypothetical protein